MTAIVVTPLLGILLGNLNNIAVHHVMLAWNMEKEHKELINKVQMINLVISDAEREQLNHKSVELWLKHLRDVADDAVDLFDEIITYWVRKKTKVRVLPFHYTMGKRLKEVRDSLTNVIENKSLILRVEQPENAWIRSNTCIENPRVFGRDIEKEQVVCDLVSGTCSLSNLSLYAVCGMGGIGKTTLVQMVYEHPSIIAHFDLRIWVSVSEDFKVSKMISAMLECIADGKYNVLNELRPLQTNLRNELDGKRFLVVLDNVWNEDTENWKPVMYMLNSGAEGSVIMMTMRDKRIVDSIRPLYPRDSTEKSLQKLNVVVHNVKKLDETESWDLFKDYIFDNQMLEEDKPEMRILGKEMLMKCGGVPLAITTLGSMIRYKQGLGAWKSIMERIPWEKGNPNTSIMPILRLSYFHLPIHLRPCFTYCSIFPKNDVYSKEELIHLWISNGFIAKEDNDDDLYCKGNEFLQELVHRSFLQGIIDRHGNPLYKMHDLLYDLASSLMPDIYSSTDVKSASKIPVKVRHLYFHIPPKYSIDGIDIGCLRSLILSSDLHISGNSLSSFIEKAKHLRVLDMGGFKVMDSSEFTSKKKEKLHSLFPKAITKLKHLRYLNMSYFSIESLPESIGSLLNLQCLGLRHCYRLRKLPNSLIDLENLTDLDFRDCPLLTSLPPGIGKLKNLQMLGLYIVAEGIGNGINQLNGLNLRGVLRIEGLNKITDAKDVEIMNIGSKENLNSLHLSWGKVSGGTKSEVREMMEKVLESLCPPKNLECLSIDLYQGSKFAEWMMKLVPMHRKLTKITLENINNCKSLPPLWLLPCLEILIIRRMEMVECFFDQNYDVTMKLFPALEVLVITSVPNFKRWTSRDLNKIVFPKLLNLEITRCNNLKVLPSCPILKMLQVDQSPHLDLSLLSECSSVTNFSLFHFPCVIFPPGLLGTDSKRVLRSLKLGNMSRLKSLSSELECLYNLTHLEIHMCPELGSLPLGLKNLKLLETLSLSCLPHLTSIPCEIFPGLSSLRILDIISCEILTILPDSIGSLKALQSLRVSHCHALKALPTDFLQQLKCLWDLGLFECKGLETSDSTRWLRNLPCLSRLSIVKCFDLTSLLDSVDAMKTLDELNLSDRTLNELNLNDLSNLEVRCKKESGSDWKKISHVRIIRINSVLIQPSLEILN